MTWGGRFKYTPSGLRIMESHTWIDSSPSNIYINFNSTPVWPHPTRELDNTDQRNILFFPVSLSVCLLSPWTLLSLLTSIQQCSFLKNPNVLWPSPFLPRMGSPKSPLYRVGYDTKTWNSEVTTFSYLNITTQCRRNLWLRVPKS